MNERKQWLCALTAFLCATSTMTVSEAADTSQLKAEMRYWRVVQEGLVSTRPAHEDALTFTKAVVTEGKAKAGEKDAQGASAKGESSKGTPAKGDTATSLKEGGSVNPTARDGKEDAKKDEPLSNASSGESEPVKDSQAVPEEEAFFDGIKPPKEGVSKKNAKQSVAANKKADADKKGEEKPSLLKGIAPSDLVTDEEWAKRRAPKPTYAVKKQWDLEDVGKGYTINALAPIQQPTSLERFVREIMKEEPQKEKAFIDGATKNDGKTVSDRKATDDTEESKSSKAEADFAQEKKGDDSKSVKAGSGKQSEKQEGSKDSSDGPVLTGPTITQNGPFITARKGTESFTTYAGVSRHDEPLHKQGLVYEYTSQWSKLIDILRKNGVEERRGRSLRESAHKGHMTNVVYVHGEDEGRRWGRDIKVGSTRRELLFSFGVPQAMWRDNQDGSILWLYKIDKLKEKPVRLLKNSRNLPTEKKENKKFAKNTTISSSATPAGSDVIYGVVTLRKGKVAALDLFDGPVWPFLQIPENTLQTFEAGKMVDEDFRVMGYALNEPFKTDPVRSWTEKGRLYRDPYIGYKDVAVASDEKGLVSRVLVHSNHGMTRRGISLGDSKYLLLFAYGMPDFEEKGDSVGGEGTVVYGYRHPYLTSTYLLFSLDTREEGGAVQSILLSDRLMKDLLNK